MKVVVIGAALLLVGVVMMAYGIMDTGNIVEKTHAYTTDPQEAYEYLYRMANKDPTPPLIDPVIILGGTIVAASGVVFLIKSKDEDFLPGI